MKCSSCGREAELRLGCCFKCAMNGERRAACRTVLQHLWKALSNLRKRKWGHMRYDLSWAWQRATRSGDYSTGGYFDGEGHPWR